MRSILHFLDHPSTIGVEIKPLPDARFGVGLVLPPATPQGNRVRADILARVELDADDRPLKLFAAGDGLISEHWSRPPRVAALRFAGLPVAAYALEDPPRRVGRSLRLPTFFLKQAALDGSGRRRDLSAAVLPDAAAPKADLHTHLSGAPSSDRLVAIGVERGLRFPARLLAAAGVQKTPDADGLVLLSTLSSAQLTTLARRMEVGVVRQLTFAEFEIAYALRKPFIRNALTLGDALWAIAREAAATGVTYLELSTSDAIGVNCFPPFLPIAREAIPRIEAETGVRLRLLAACKRMAAPESVEEDFARLKRHAQDRLIVGVDLNGHEADPVDAFTARLEGLARWAKDESVDWQFRVHAGESPRQPANVKAALRVAERVGMPIRIGHGVYGVDDEAIDLARRTGSIVEMQPTSNLALANIHKPEALPLRRWLDGGVAVVPGTDGTGVILTSIPQETAVLRVVGADDAELARMAETVERIRANEAARSARLENAPQPPAPTQGWAPAPRLKASSRPQLEAAVRKAGLTLADPAQPFTAQGLAKRVPVLISGSAVGRFPQRDRDVVHFLAALIGRICQVVDPYRVVLVTDGTGSEAESILGREAAQARIPVLVTLTGDSAPEAAETPGLTHAVILDGGHSERLPALLPSLLGRPLAALYAGGGSVVADEIRLLLNAGIDPILVRGIAGASSWNAKQQPRLAVFDGDGAARALRYHGAPLLPEAPW